MELEEKSLKSLAAQWFILGCLVIYYAFIRFATEAYYITRKAGGGTFKFEEAFYLTLEYMISTANIWFPMAFMLGIIFWAYEDKF